MIYRPGFKTDVQCKGKNKHIGIMDFSSIKWTALQTTKTKVSSLYPVRQEEGFSGSSSPLLLVISLARV